MLNKLQQWIISDQLCKKERYMKMELFAIIFFVLQCSIPADAADVTAMWTAPTARVDGSALLRTDLATFTLYCSTTADGAGTVIAVVPGSVDRTIASSCVTNGIGYFTVTVTTTDGATSARSNIATKTFSPSNPNTPEIPACPAPPPIFIVSAISGQTSRPMYSDSFVAIGRINFLMPDGTSRRCDTTATIKPGTTSKYYHAFDDAGKRSGLTICKVWKP